MNQRTKDMLFALIMIFLAFVWGLYHGNKLRIPRRPCQTVTIAVPGPVAVIRVDGSTILVNEKEFALPAGHNRLTVRVMNCQAIPQKFP